MRIAVASCFKYADAWPGFFGLWRKFWPDCPYPIHLITDAVAEKDLLLCENMYVCTGSWCDMVGAFAKTYADDDGILLLQEDFFLSAPVQAHLIERGLEQLKKALAGCVRLYPCPGGIKDYGDPHFAIVPRGTRYRVSCMAAIWQPRYLAAIARIGKSPADFEIHGTPHSCDFLNPVLAFKRDVQPWPIEYLCSAISRGQWNPEAKRLCDAQEIMVDWTMRKFQTA